MIRAAAGVNVRRVPSLVSIASAELPWQPELVRFYVVSTEPPVPEIKINENLSLQKSLKVPKRNQEQRPLVMLYSWLAAKQRHLGNFTQFYLDKGCDVLTIKVKPLQILFPETGAQILAHNIVNFVQTEEHREQPILVHSFSVGGYLYSEVLRSMIATETNGNEITNRIIGQIYDSPVDFDNIPIGMSKVLLKNSVMQTGLKKTLEMYLRMTHNIAGQHHQRCSRLFHHNPVTAPSLFLYSDIDPITSPRAIERAIASLKDNMGHTSVRGKQFKSSPHVSHMYKHRDEYVSTLQSFLEQIDFKKVADPKDPAIISDVGSEDDTMTPAEEDGGRRFETVKRESAV